MADAYIEVEGLKETLAAFDKLGGELPEKLRGELADVADKVSDAAAFIAQRKGDVYHGVPTDHGDPSRVPGDLVHKINVRKSGKGFAVVEYSKTRSKKYPQGYSYPRRLEYGPGNRSFMRPAAAQMTPYAVKAIDEMVDRLTAEKGF